MSADEMKAGVAAVGELLERASAELAEGLGQVKKVFEACEGNADLDGQAMVPALQGRHDRAEGRIEKAKSSVEAAQQQAARKAFAEVDQKRSEFVTAIRSKMCEEGKMGDELFDSLFGGALGKEKFTSLLRDFGDLNLAEEQAARLADHIVGDAAELGKERFLELIRLYYKCLRQTVMSEELSIKSKTVRRLEAGEVLECLEGPAKEEGAGVQRVRCQTASDGAVGWVTIQGNQGTPFLEPGGNFFACVKETLITEALSVDSPPVRRVASGEVIEVLEFMKKDSTLDIKRIKGKAKLDGATGYITVSGTSGTTFLEPC